MRYFKVPRAFTLNDRNPFTEDGTYGSGWSALFILDRHDGYAFMGTGNEGLFAYQYSRNADNITEIVADYLRYEELHKRNAILSCPSDMDVDAFVQQALAATPKPHTVRKTDPKYLVHSTSLSASKKIMEEGELKSLVRLKATGSQAYAPRLGFDSLGEPTEYADHICLGDSDSVGPERVTAENAAGRFLSDPENQVYDPGARFYFNCQRIVLDGLDIRIVGSIKVKGNLPLDPYLVAHITLDDLPASRPSREWTPKSFTAEANEVFLHRLDKSD